MVKATDVVYKYNEGEFAVKHKKDGFKAGSNEVLIGYDKIRTERKQRKFFERPYAHRGGGEVV